MSFHCTHMQILNMHFSGQVSTEEFELWLSRIERFLIKKQYFVLVMQTVPETIFPENYRQQQALWYKRFKKEFFKYCLGLTRIAQDEADRRRLNTPALHAAWQVPYHVSLDLKSSLQWAVQRWSCRT